MIRVGIVTRDAYRTWEMKAIRAAMARRRVEPMIIDPLNFSVDVAAGGLLDRRGQPTSVDVALGRVDLGCLQEGVRTLDALAMIGIPLVNDADAFRRGRDKALASLALAQAGIPHPRAWLAERVTAYKMSDELPYPIVVKPLHGSQGKGVRRIDSPKALAHFLAGHRGRVYLQEFVPDAERDLRLLALGGRVIGAIHRKKPPGEWRANVALGAAAEPIEPTDSLSACAVRAASALKASFAGVDILQTPRGPVVLEVNVCPSFRGVSLATGADVAGLLVDHLLSAWEALGR